jgi:hypothetical protein
MFEAVGHGVAIWKQHAAMLKPSETVLRRLETTRGHAEAVGHGVALFGNNRRPC